MQLGLQPVLRVTLLWRYTTLMVSNLWFSSLALFLTSCIRVCFCSLEKKHTRMQEVKKSAKLEKTQVWNHKCRVSSKKGHPKHKLKTQLHFISCCPNLVSEGGFFRNDAKTTYQFNRNLKFRNGNIQWNRQGAFTRCSETRWMRTHRIKRYDDKNSSLKSHL